jgi:tRNA/tmRNA/rRNA uracil-C5-methylase (TrmA/RlmC/RlmD family)
MSKRRPPKPRRDSKPSGTPSRGRAKRPSGALLELRIDALAAGGDGVGRAEDGRVVFVPFTAPGDRVRVRTESERPRFIHAKLDAVLEPSPQRSEPRCAVFGRCGGCAWQHIDYGAQLEAKAKIVADAFGRIAKIDLPDKPAIVASPSAYGYRSRARVFAEGGRVGFRERRSHDLCETANCPILSAPLQAELAALARAAPQRDAEWELVGGDEDSRALEVGRAAGGRIGWRLGGDRFEVSPGVFAQSNALLFEPLAAAVVASAGRGALAYDFFAGAGFFTLGLARNFTHVLALESNAAASRDLAHNLAASGASNVTVTAARFEDALRDEALADDPPDVVVVDPPRTGLPPDTCSALAALDATRIVYLACDPATQARDVADLSGHGYRVAGVEAFDLFPQTPHVESLAVLERS